MDARTSQPTHQTHQTLARGWRPERCDRVALVLQGGGALGAYQAGVYQALHEAGIEPDWVTGVSIGAINSAIIAGNKPEKRLEALRIFWERITNRKIWIGIGGSLSAPPLPHHRAYGSVHGGSAS